MDLDPTGRYLFTGSRDKKALVYDLTTGQLAAELGGQVSQSVMR